MHHGLRAVEIFDPEQHSELALRYLLDPGVHAHVQMAMCTFSLGHPDQALDWANRMVGVGSSSAHPNGLAFATTWRSLFFALRGDAESVVQHHDECLARARELQAGVLPIAGVVHGWALVRLGQADEGIARLEAAIAAWEGHGMRAFLSWFRLYLIESYIAHD